METPDLFYHRILSEGPSSATFFLLLSRLKSEGRIRRVIQGCIRALDIFPNDIHIRRLLAESYLETGQITQAEAELSKVIEQVGELIPSFKLQAEIYSRQARKEEAIQALMLYLAHRPGDQEALDLLETLKTEEVILPEISPRAEEALQEPPPLPLMGRAKGGEEFMEEAAPPSGLERLPQIATPTLAEIYLDQNQPQEAIAIYEKVIAQNPGDKRSRRRLEELMHMVRGETPVEPEGGGKTRQKKEKMVALLESWLLNIRKKASMPVEGV